jgi:hypothetical protein
MMTRLSERKWFYPLIYFLLIVISFLPPLTEIPYDPRSTQKVIMTILKNSITPYAKWGWVFHVITLILVGITFLKKKIAGRFFSIYFGLNYLVIAAVQTSARTEAYGFALQTGALVAGLLLGIIWLVSAFRDEIQASFKGVPVWRYALLPLALLVFWSPLRADGVGVSPDFNPFLLLTSPDYGLTYCFFTPVALFFLILFYPKVPRFALRVTAFNGLIYGIFNLTHWFSADTVWLGVLHIPLLVISLVALLMPSIERKRERAQEDAEKGGRGF